MVFHQEITECILLHTVSKEANITEQLMFQMYHHSCRLRIKHNNKWYRPKEMDQVFQYQRHHLLTKGLLAVEHLNKWVKEITKRIKKLSKGWTICFKGLCSCLMVGFWLWTMNCTNKQLKSQLCWIYSMEHHCSSKLYWHCNNNKIHQPLNPKAQLPKKKRNNL